MYTTVTGFESAAAAAAALANTTDAQVGDLAAQLPLLIDQVVGEAGVAEPQLAVRALAQARGDIARAVSLLRAWVATVPRLETSRANLAELAVDRRVTPGFLAPAGGQYLGASLDYAQRLLRLSDEPAPSSYVAESAAVQADPPGELPRSLLPLEADGLVAPPDPPATTGDLTRRVANPIAERGAFQQLLSRAETGALTALAYTAQRGYAQRQDPTLTELRSGTLPVTVTHPRTGESVEVGRVATTIAEIVFYRVHDGTSDARFTLGFGATFGRVERRSIAAAMLDAGCARAAAESAEVKAPADDQEFLALALDGQEATGFVEHLKLPHHVTFSSDLDRVRRARAGGDRVAEEVNA
jgi:alpha-D-ribose 1-methylphosphonate 5-triphosphate synthase subunit PhnI